MKNSGYVTAQTTRFFSWKFGSSSLPPSLPPTHGIEIKSHLFNTISTLEHWNPNPSYYHIQIIWSTVHLPPPPVVFGLPFSVISHLVLMYGIKPLSTLLYLSICLSCISFSHQLLISLFIYIFCLAINSRRTDPNKARSSLLRTAMVDRRA